MCSEILRGALKLERTSQRLWVRLVSTVSSMCSSAVWRSCSYTIHWGQTFTAGEKATRLNPSPAQMISGGAEATCVFLCVSGIPASRLFPFPLEARLILSNLRNTVYFPSPAPTGICTTSRLCTVHILPPWFYRRAETSAWLGDSRKGLDILQ